ncbi:unnamed protein product, partial [Didymodactylos carnosus]
LKCFIPNLYHKLHCLKRLAIVQGLMDSPFGKAKEEIYGLILCDKLPQTLKTCILDLKLLSHMPKLKYLKIVLTTAGYDDSLNTLFSSFPNLIELSLYCICYTNYEECLFDGLQWEKFILMYLPRLKICRLWFRIKMMKLSEIDKINELIINFEQTTNIWKQRKWLVKCEKLKDELHLVLTIPEQQLQMDITKSGGFGTDTYF